MSLRDQQARDKIAEALDRNMMVLAGAGAGKTHALVQRMANAVEKGVVPVDQLSAITFTRKAAGEMRGRFFSELKSRAQNADGEDLDRIQNADGEDLDRIQNALEKVDQCFIGTIHSFCGQLLRERPVEAGLPPDFSEVEEREEAVMRREAWDTFVQQSFLSEDPRLAKFEELGLRPEDLYGFFQRRYQFSDVPLVSEPVQKPDLSTAVSELEAFLQRTGSLYPRSTPRQTRCPPDSIDARAIIPVEPGNSVRRGSHRTPANTFSGNLGVTLKSWTPNQDFAKHLRDTLLPEFQTEILDPTLTRWRQYIYRFAAPFVDDAVA